MPEHVHVHAPHELHETNESIGGTERWLEITAALLLAVSTLAIAWSGYQAAKWSGVQARRFTQASAARSLANRAESDADEERLQDIVNFNRWIEATEAGDDPVASLYERRFRAEFKVAFDAWLAQGDPLNDPDAVASPLDLPQYRDAHAEESDRLETLGDLRFAQGKEATETADKYVFSTVFFAIVLFFSGVSLRFRWMRLRMAMLAAAAAFLVLGLVQLGSLPTQ